MRRPPRGVERLLYSDKVDGNVRDDMNRSLLSPIISEGEHRLAISFWLTPVGAAGMPECLLHA